ncbi:MAG: hypothetical protein ACI906_004289 [Candidatus Latescibacterota bacterium]|jgi:hypothetical protein
MPESIPEIQDSGALCHKGVTKLGDETILYQANLATIFG